MEKGDINNDFERLFFYYRIRDSKTDERRKSGDLKNDLRSPIESDYGRLVFSSAFRRLHDKTQVFPLTTNDNIHSRLTHSVEVVSVGKSFALKVCGDEEIVKKLGFKTDSVAFWKDVTALMEVICLAHDIGNPPLGHFGETAIQNYFTDLFSTLKHDLENNNKANPIIRSEMERIGANLDGDIPQEIYKSIGDFVNERNYTCYDYTQFDGNAEGFRILTKLQFLNDLYGLNLTAASLAASVKYPNVAKLEKKKGDIKPPISQKKHGVFFTEKHYLDDVMGECEIEHINEYSYRRHPFAYLMEAADTICYLLMDLEDAISKGWLTYYDVTTVLKRIKKGDEIVRRAGNHFLENDPEKKKIVQLRTELMISMVNECFDNFKRHFDDIEEGKYKEELVFENKEDLNELTGKKYQDIAQRLLSQAALAKTRIARKKLADFFKQEKPVLSEIRHNTGAHREHDFMKQMEVLEGVGWSGTIDRLHRFEEVTLELGKTMKPLMEAGEENWGGFWEIILCI